MQTSSATKDMFCFQCEQTQNGSGCVTVGVCGKTPETAALQDLLVHQVKGISTYANRLTKLGEPIPANVNEFTLQSLFSTLTNVNFDSERFVGSLKQSQEILNNLKNTYQKKSNEKVDGKPFDLQGFSTLEQLEQRGHEVGILKRKEVLGEDITGLQELITYGIKGMAAYADHALVLGKQDPAVSEFIYQAFDSIQNGNLGANELLDLAMKVGQMNLRVMGLLEEGGTGRYGNPVPTQVRVTPVKGKCILVSGHDLRDVEEVLKQTQGTGINVYTHGELLPAHGYPKLKQPHLVGNYGGAWQLQKMDFAAFPGPIVMTTNCLIEPKKSYKDRLFTRSVVGWPGVKHIDNYNFKPVVDLALASKGFEKDEPARYVTVGFGKNTVLGLADTVINAIKTGDIKHFFFIGGCDGSEGERNYFKELALATPKDSVILTAGCGKFRFNKFNFGTTNGGIPRLLDVGQCNDSYGAIQIAVALAKALNMDVKDLPLSFAVSWFEQKAVAVLLSLLSLNIQNIHLGPHLPGFCTPTMLKILQDKFQLKTINLDIQQELSQMLKNN
jgi:hydroxylamine reductase